MRWKSEIENEANIGGSYLLQCVMAHQREIIKIYGY